MGAACFGATQCFKRLLEMNKSNDKFEIQNLGNFVFSFLDYSLTDKNQDFPTKIRINEKTLLVGAGAVGSAVVYGFSKIPQMEGTISVVDNDIFDKTNLNRCLLAYIDTIGKNKAKISELHSSQNLTFESYPMLYKDLKPNDYPLILSAVDNNEVRHEIQRELPKLIFHGATGNQISAVSVIKFLENGCFGCIFKLQTKSWEEIIFEETRIPLQLVIESLKNNSLFSTVHLEYIKKEDKKRAENYEKYVGKQFDEVFQKEICSKLNIVTNNKQKTASVSFVSFFAGLGIISEFIKYSCKINNVPLMIDRNFYQINMFKPGHIPSPTHRKKNPRCTFCSDTDIKQRFSEKWSINN